MTMNIVVCAGEASGDQLASGLVRELKLRYPDAQFFGIAGPKMVEAGCEAWHNIEELSVMGFVDVLKQLPRLLRLRKSFMKKVLAIKPTLYVGIDAPDFNLPIEKKLKSHGVKTVHYVSPTVWAWRQGRIHGIKKAVDLMLTIFPFEQQIYQQYQIPVCYVGHPRAAELAACKPKEQVRAQLSLPIKPHTFALLPGSRHAEVSSLAPVFLSTLQRLQEKGVEFTAVMPAANAKLYRVLQHELQQFPTLTELVTITDGQAELALAAADIVLTVSGTSTLETMLVGRPMVVAYKMPALNWLIARWLVKIKYCSLPNLLADEALVPEFLQEHVTTDNLVAAVMQLMASPVKLQQLQQRFAAISESLNLDSDTLAANAIVSLLENECK